MPTLPARLHPGDTVGLIAPASAPADPNAIDRCAAALEAMGFKVRLGRHVRKRLGYLAGTARERAEDIMRMFTDHTVNGMTCVRGGYGTARLLPLLDYAAIRKNPKVLVGFSDITTLHCALLKKSGLVTFHGPMVTSNLLKPDCPEFTRKSLLRMITEPLAAGSICQGYNRRTISILRKGRAEGELIGGNLAVLCGLIGTPYQPSFRRKILFLEEVDEEPYRVDRLLTHLMNAGVLGHVAGVALGVCEGCLDPKARTAGEYRQTLEDVLRDRLLPLKVPVVVGLPFGHGRFNATLPVGGRAMLDALRGDLVLTSSAVR